MNYFLNHYRRLLALADAGLFYGKDVFDKERYAEIRSISIELLSQLSDEPLETLSDIVSEHEGYPTPKVDVRAFIKKEEKILLVQDAQSNEWSLPGGYAEVGLSPKENIKKEVREETGFEVTVNQLLGIFDTQLREDIPQLFQYYKLVFSCTIEKGAFQENNETSQIAFFELNDLPVLFKKRTTKEQLLILENNTDVFFD